MTMTEEIHTLILQNASAGDIKRAARASMQTMREDGWQKVCDGKTTVAEVLQVTHFDDGE
jgi:type II secretory ATPase GspE/PulE/Tfp pilus assembly ATPase PilB-like protein